MRTLESPLARAAAASWFGLRRAYYRARYPRRLEMGPGVLFVGKLRIGRGTKLVLGARCRIRQTVLVNGGGVAVVGSDTLLNGCWLGTAERIEIGAWSLISDCNISDTDFHNLSPAERHAPLSAKATAPVVIGRNTWIGARAIVLKGTRIGDDSVVGAGSVVRGEVAEGVVVAGNPAVQVKTFSPDERTSPAAGAVALPAQATGADVAASLPTVPEQRILPVAAQSGRHLTGPRRTGR